MGRRDSRSKKRKFRGNQHCNRTKSPRVDDSALESECTFQSVSARKIQPESEESSRSNADNLAENATGYRFIDMELLAELFKHISCRECHSSALLLEDNPRERYGCASHLRVRCDHCGWVYTFYTSKKVNHFFDINRRFVYAMRAVGQGEASARRFCAHMNLPLPLSPKSYSDCNNALSDAAKTVALSTMKDAAVELHNGSSDEVMTACKVSCDGTWQRRGYSSLNGCVTTISVDTGKCLDVEVLSKVCHTCKRIENEKNEDTKAIRQAEHIGKCKANFQGSAPAMETEGVARIFLRSEELHNLQYTEFFGDGDSKAYNRVEKIYKNVHVEKKECVGHVQKRVGTALRKLKKENKGFGGKGKLTDSIIDKMQNYYGIAIRSNSGNLSGMKSNILASLFHCASSSRRNLHNHCPDGADSWCRFKQDKANGTNTYKPGPGLPDTIIAKIKPIYARLSSDDLLKKCLDGKTQNANESLNGMIWNRLPKSVFVGSTVLSFGVYDAVAHFNIGTRAAENILKEMGMEPGKFFLNGMRKIDKERISKANFQNKEETRKRRKVLRGLKKAKNDKLVEKEGSTYQAGAF